MADLCALLHEISVAFGCSTNLRTLILRLADGMGRHLPIAEIETVRLVESSGEVAIHAYAPGILRHWDGRRSARFLERQGVVAPTIVTDELARVAIAPVAMKLKLPVGRTGMLVLSFETDISVMLGSAEHTDILVDVLTLHCLRLGQLTATANRCRAAMHRQVATEMPVDDHRASSRGRDTEMPLKSAGSHTPPAEQGTGISRAAGLDSGRSSTEISVNRNSTDISAQGSSTEISVQTIDEALIRCISAALDQTRGKIYGPGGAAELLGLKPSTLQSKMRKLGIDRAQFAH